MAGTVKMQRDGKTAEVHPDEVKNYGLSGWQPVETAKPAAKKKAASKSTSKPVSTDKATG